MRASFLLPFLFSFTLGCGNRLGIGTSGKSVAQIENERNRLIELANEESGPSGKVVMFAVTGIIMRSPQETTYLMVVKDNHELWSLKSQLRSFRTMCQTSTALRRHNRALDIEAAKRDKERAEQRMKKKERREKRRAQSKAQNQKWEREQRVKKEAERLARKKVERERQERVTREKEEREQVRNPPSILRVDVGNDPFLKTMKTLVQLESELKNQPPHKKQKFKKLNESKELTISNELAAAVWMVTVGRSDVIDIRPSFSNSTKSYSIRLGRFLLLRSTRYKWLSGAKLPLLDTATNNKDVVKLDRVTFLASDNDRIASLQEVCAERKTKAQKDGTRRYPIILQIRARAKLQYKKISLMDAKLVGDPIFPGPGTGEKTNPLNLPPPTPTSRIPQVSRRAPRATETPISVPRIPLPTSRGVSGKTQASTPVPTDAPFELGKPFERVTKKIIDVPFAHIFRLPITERRGRSRIKRDHLLGIQYVCRAPSLKDAKVQQVVTQEQERLRKFARKLRTNGNIRKRQTKRNGVDVLRLDLVMMPNRSNVKIHAYFYIKDGVLVHAFHMGYSYRTHKRYYDQVQSKIGK